jgi:hypothetical protein
MPQSLLRSWVNNLAIRDDPDDVRQAAGAGHSDCNDRVVNAALKLVP